MRILVGMVLVALGASLASGPARAAVTLENETISLTISSQGTVTGLRDLVNDRDLLGAEDQAFFSAELGDNEIPATIREYADGVLTLDLAGSGVTARVRVKIKPAYLAFELAELAGPQIEALTLGRLPVKPLEHFGSWLNTIWDDDFALCFMAANVETDCRSSRSDEHGCVICLARADPEVKLVGAEYAILGSPRETVLDAIDGFEVDYGLPRGGKQRQLPDQKWSYFWPSPTPQSIDEDIEWALKGGFRQLCISYTAFSSSAGHFPWRSTYPGGLEELKAVVAKVKAAGLSPGVHIHFNKAHKHDPYVTPVPDPRLYKDREIELAADAEDAADFLPTIEAPREWPTEDGQRDLQVGDEIVQYARLSLEEPFGFAGCRRGALGTRAAAHTKGDSIYRLGVDRGWPIFIRFDQTTDIQQEVAEYLGALYEEAGFEWTYFDGSEDVHDPYWYLVPKAQLEVYKRMDPEPTTSEAAALTHFSWHMMSRSNAYDSEPPEELKDFCRKRPCQRAARNAENFTGVDFGWLTYTPRTPNTIGTQPDHIEFYWSRAAAWDCPVAFHTSPVRLKSNARTTDSIEIIRQWEEARMSGWLTEEQKGQLRNLEQEHMLLVNENGQRELLPYDQIEDCAGGDDRLRAFVFERGGDPWVVFWHTYGQGLARLDLPHDRVKLFRPLGTELEVKQGDGGRLAIEFSDRQFLQAVGLTREQVIEAFQSAEVEQAPGTYLWVDAADFADKVGEMTLGSEAGLEDEGALGDFIVCTGQPDRNEPKEWYCEYTVDIPRAGMWHVWGRLRYPAGGDMSFGFVVPGEEVTLSGNQVLGNSGTPGDVWHWDSRGSGVTSVPGTAFVSRYLPAGPFTFHIYAREGSGNLQTNPRLDVILLTEDAAFQPTDEDARRALEQARQ
jgi:hypothetical protein